MNNNIRYQRGWEKMKEVDGESGEHVFDSLKDFSPDLATYLIEYSFGDVYNREGIDLKTKEIAVVAALVVMGNAVPQLKVHLNGALNVGCSISELKEVILQMSGYAGFPASLNAMLAFKEVVQVRKESGRKDQEGLAPAAVNSPQSRYEQGAEKLSEYDAQQVQRLNEAFGDFCPDMVRYTLEYGYADIANRNNLDVKLRQVATIAALTASGSAAPQLKFHINAGLNIGLTEEQIGEIMILMTVYAGFPRALNGMFILKDVITERK